MLQVGVGAQQSVSAVQGDTGTHGVVVVVVVVVVVEPKSEQLQSLGGNSIEIFGLSFGLKNCWRFHFDSVTCLNYPF